LNGRYFLLEFKELELVVLALKQAEIDLTLAGLDFDLIDHDGKSLIWILSNTVLDELVVAVDDFKKVRITHQGCPIYNYKLLRITIHHRNLFRS
jgi:hypothetical protein